MKGDTVAELFSLPMCQDGTPWMRVGKDALGKLLVLDTRYAVLAAYFAGLDWPADPDDYPETCMGLMGRLLGVSDATTALNFVLELHAALVVAERERAVRWNARIEAARAAAGIRVPFQLPVANNTVNLTKMVVPAWLNNGGTQHFTASELSQAVGAPLPNITRVILSKCHLSDSDIHGILRLTKCFPNAIFDLRHNVIYGTNCRGYDWEEFCKLSDRMMLEGNWCLGNSVKSCALDEGGA